jgi:hypothetical protein
MVLQQGDNVLVVHRRLFESDQPRYLLGVVVDREGDLATVTGQTWARDYFSSVAAHKDDVRTKVISLSSGTLIVYRLPRDSDLAAARIETDEATGATWLTDGSTLRMDLSEQVSSPHAA